MGQLSTSSRIIREGIGDGEKEGSISTYHRVERTAAFEEFLQPPPFTHSLSVHPGQMRNTKGNVGDIVMAATFMLPLFVLTFYTYLFGLFVMPIGGLATGYSLTKSRKRTVLHGAALGALPSVLAYAVLVLYLIAAHFEVQAGTASFVIMDLGIICGAIGGAAGASDFSFFDADADGTKGKPSA